MASGPLGMAIPIKDRPLIKHNSPYLPDGPLLIASWGASGSGKSQSMLATLPSIANLDFVIICTLISGNTVNRRVKDWCEATGKEYVECNDPNGAEEIIRNTCDRLNGKDGASANAFNVQKQRWAIVIYDDFIDDWSNENPAVQSLNVTVSMRRNYHVHSWYISQSYARTPMLVRSNANIRFLFEMKSRRDIDKAADDYIGAGIVSSPREFIELINLTMNGGRFSFLMVVIISGDKRVYVHLNDKGAGHIERIGTSVIGRTPSTPSLIGMNAVRPITPGHSPSRPIAQQRQSEAATGEVSEFDVVVARLKK